MSKFTFDRFHDYRLNGDQMPGHIGLQPPIPYTGEPGHRYGNGSPLPGASIKGRYSSSGSASPNYRPTFKEPPRPMSRERSFSNSRSSLPKLSISVSPRGTDRMSDTQSLSRSHNSSQSYNSRRAASAPKRTVSPYHRVQSILPLESMRKSRKLKSPNDFDDNRSMSSLAPYQSRYQMLAAGYTDPIGLAQDDFSINYRSQQKSYNSDRYGNEESSNGIAKRETDNYSISSMNGLSSLASSAKYQKKMQSTHRIKIIEDIKDPDRARKEKLDSLVRQFRESLIADAGMFADNSGHNILFPTRCPRTVVIQDARNRILHMASMWKHACIQTIGNLDKTYDIHTDLTSRITELKRVLKHKKATVESMVQQKRSLSNYLAHLRQQAADRGLGQLVFEKNPFLDKHLQDYAKDNDRPIDDRLFRLWNQDVEQRDTNQTSMNLHSVRTNDMEVFEKMPPYAKQMLTTSWKSNGITSSSSSTTPTMTKATRNLVKPTRIKLSDLMDQPASSMTLDDVNYNGYASSMTDHTQKESHTGRRPHHAPRQQIDEDGNYIEQDGYVGDEDGTYYDEYAAFDEWGHAIGRINPSTNELAKSMALKNLSIRAMLALSPQNRIIHREGEMDEEDNYLPSDYEDNSSSKYLESSSSKSYKAYNPSNDIYHSSNQQPRLTPTNSKDYSNVYQSSDHIQHVTPTSRSNSMSLSDLAKLDVQRDGRMFNGDERNNRGTHTGKKGQGDPYSDYNANGHDMNGNGYSRHTPGNGRLETQSGTKVQGMTPQEISQSSPRGTQHKSLTGYTMPDFDESNSSHKSPYPNGQKRLTPKIPY